MTDKSNDLHGNAPDSCPVALVIIDMINDLEFDEGPQFLQSATEAAHCIAHLKERARQLNIPVIYVNDNLGHWRSDFKQIVAHCLRDGVRGRPLVEALKPDETDYFVLKPKHSAFYATPLDILLTYLNVKRLIFTGLSTDVCVQFSAQDAYLRDFELYVPQDCVAADLSEHTQSGLDYMQRVLSAETMPSTELDLPRLIQAEPDEN